MIRVNDRCMKAHRYKRNEQTCIEDDDDNNDMIVICHPHELISKAPKKPNET